MVKNERGSCKVLITKVGSMWVGSINGLEVIQTKDKAKCIKIMLRVLDRWGSNHLVVRIRGQ